MATYLSNAFSLSMLANLPASEPIALQAQRVDLGAARALLASGSMSVVGHADTAQILSDLLGMRVPCNRVPISLAPGDTLVVAQYSGPRLPEGATTLPDGATFDWWTVRVTG